MSLKDGAGAAAVSQKRWVVERLNVWYFLSNMEGRFTMEGEWCASNSGTELGDGLEKSLPARTGQHSFAWVQSDLGIGVGLRKGCAFNINWLSNQGP